MLKSTGKIRRIYMDYASSANHLSANPGAIHALGVQEKSKLENARAIIAKILNAHSREIIFTSGATESNNLVILGLIYACQKYIGVSYVHRKLLCIPHIVTTNIEHASVLEVCRYLERTKKAEVTFVPVEANGIIDPLKIKKAFQKNTVLVSVMYANNEIGTIQPIREIAKEIRHYNKTNFTKILFHTDAVQAVNYLPISIPQLGVDLMSINGAKIYGPKGIGALYVKKGTLLVPIMFGGDQEFGLRPGTENVALATEFVKALQAVEKIKEKETKRLTKLRDYFISKLIHSTILKNYRIVLNGDSENRLPNNVNVIIPNIPSDLLVIELSARGIMVSAKSACKSGDGKASHVIEAINRNIQEENGSLRFSLGRETTKRDIDYTVKSLSEILIKLKEWYTR